MGTQLFTQGISVVFRAQGIELPASDEKGEGTDSTSAEGSFDAYTKVVEDYSNVFYLVLEYFFIAGGIALIVMGILSVLWYVSASVFDWKCSS